LNPRTAEAHLVLFDVDDTLVESQAIDSDLYLRALQEVFGLGEVHSDWSAYRNTTDSGILAEVFETRFGRSPTAEEAARFRSHFVEAVTAAGKRVPFREIAGARHLLRHLRALPSHHLGLATGGFSDSARFKMRSAGMDYDEFAAASADDARPRVSIMKIAIERTLVRAACDRPTSVVYVGDGIWDARACRELGVPFIGIAAGARAGQLRAEGASAVLPNYARPEQFCEALARARHAMVASSVGH
jgi:phosphoglycolate phosphatase-like HAD superfamily hydrolase